MSKQAENELLCERLLGWKRSKDPGYWHHDDFFCKATPTFLTGDGMLLLLDALRALGLDPSLEHNNGKWDCCGGDPYEKWFHAYADSAPDAVRAAALEHLRASEQAGEAP